MEQQLRFKVPWPTRKHGWFAVLRTVTPLEMEYLLAQASSYSFLSPDTIVAGDGLADSVTTVWAEVVAQVSAAAMSSSNGISATDGGESTVGSPGVSVSTAWAEAIVDLWANAGSASTGTSTSDGGDASIGSPGVSTSTAWAEIVAGLTASASSASTGAVTNDGGESTIGSPGVSTSTAWAEIVAGLLADASSASAGTSTTDGGESTIGSPGVSTSTAWAGIVANLNGIAGSSSTGQATNDGGEATIGSPGVSTSTAWATVVVNALASAGSSSTGTSATDGGESTIGSPGVSTSTAWATVVVDVMANAGSASAGTSTTDGGESAIGSPGVSTSTAWAEIVVSTSANANSASAGTSITDGGESTVVSPGVSTSTAWASVVVGINASAGSASAGSSATDGGESATNSPGVSTSTAWATIVPSVAAPAGSFSASLSGYEGQAGSDATSFSGPTNYVTNTSFENAGLYVGPPGVLSTDFARTGTRSLKLVGTGGNTGSAILTNKTGIQYFPSEPGKVYYVEAWVRGTPTNSVNAGAAYIQVFVTRNLAGVPTNNWLATGGCTVATTTALNNGWTKISGYTPETPSDTYQFSIQVGLNGTATNEVYYFDDPVVLDRNLVNIQQGVTGAALSTSSIISATSSTGQVSQTATGTITSASTVTSATTASLTATQTVTAAVNSTSTIASTATSVAAVTVTAAVNSTSTVASTATAAISITQAVTATVSSTSTATPRASAVAFTQAVKVESESSPEADEESLFELPGSTTATVPATGVWWPTTPIVVEPWVSYVYLALLGGGGSGNGGGLLGGNGQSGRGAVWAAEQSVSVAAWFAKLGLNRDNYTVQMQYQVGAGGAPNQAGTTYAASSIILFTAVPKAGVTPGNRILLRYEARGGQNSAIAAIGDLGLGLGGPAGGGPVTGGNAGFNNVNVALNDKVYVGGTGGPTTTTNMNVAPQYPGSGACGGVAFGNNSIAGSRGVVHWRFFSTTKYTTLTFNTPTVGATWAKEVIPLGATEINFAVLGGGAGSGGGNTLAAGRGGDGGKWNTIPSINPLIIPELLTAKGLTDQDIKELFVEYQVGYGGNPGSNGSLTGTNGFASAARLIATKLDNTRVELTPANIVGAGGIAQPWVLFADQNGGAASGGNGGIDRLVNIRGKQVRFPGGKGTAGFAVQSAIDGFSPGGGASGGIIFLLGSIGARGANGVVHVVYG